MLKKLWETTIFEFQIKKQGNIKIKERVKQA